MKFLLSFLVAMVSVLSSAQAGLILDDIQGDWVSITPGENSDAVIEYSTYAENLLEIYRVSVRSNQEGVDEAHAIFHSQYKLEEAGEAQVGERVAIKIKATPLFDRSANISPSVAMNFSDKEVFLKDLKKLPLKFIVTKSLLSFKIVDIYSLEEVGANSVLRRGSWEDMMNTAENSEGFFELQKFNAGVERRVPLTRVTMPKGSLYGDAISKEEILAELAVTEVPGTTCDEIVQKMKSKTLGRNNYCLLKNKVIASCLLNSFITQDKNSSLYLLLAGKDKSILEQRGLCR